MKNIVIYGASSAIATEYAKLVLAQRAKLFLIGRDISQLKRVERDLSVRFNLPLGEIHCLQANFSDAENLQASLDSAVAFLGRIDRVLVAHGSLPDQEASEECFSLVEYHHQVNYLSVVAICEKAAQYFIEGSKKGNITVISSVAGDRGRKSNYFYGASKGALSLYLQGLRGRLSASRISVLTVKPGFVDTPMTRHLSKGALWASPEKVARGIVKAEKKRKEVVYVPFFWRGIMIIIKLIPETLFKKLPL